MSALLRLVDELRDRRVTYVKTRIGELELECNLPPREALSLPVSQAERDRLMQDPQTPDEIKERLSEEDERDLYAAAG